MTPSTSRFDLLRIWEEILFRLRLIVGHIADVQPIAAGKLELLASDRGYVHNWLLQPIETAGRRPFGCGLHRDRLAGTDLHRRPAPLDAAAAGGPFRHPDCSAADGCRGGHRIGFDFHRRLLVWDFHSDSRRHHLHPVGLADWGYSAAEGEAVDYRKLPAY